MLTSDRRRGQQCGQHILVGNDAVQHRARRDLARPAEERRHAPCAFPVGVLLTAERRIRAIRPGVILRAIVSGIHDDGVIGDAQLIDLVEDFSDLFVVGDHTVTVIVLAALAQILSARCVLKCIAVELYHRKKGLSALTCFSIQPMAPAVISSSTVSMRFLVRAPVSSMVCLPTRPQRGSVVASSLSLAKQ